MNKRYSEIVDYIKSVIGNFTPTFGVVLGSGLGDFVDNIDTLYSIEYKDIPNFPVSTVVGHKGFLHFGKVGDKCVVIMQGRFHYYESGSTQNLTTAIRVLRLLGVEFLLLSNAAGGINPNYNVGDIVVLTNHINLIPNPLIGANDEQFGERFPEMKCPYSLRLIDIANTIADLKSGVYVAVTGPSLETESEIKYFGMIGGDLVGMSTAPEAIVANHCGMEVFAVSVVTNSTSKESSHQEVVEQGKLASVRMSKLFIDLIRGVLITGFV